MSHRLAIACLAALPLALAACNKEETAPETPAGQSSTGSAPSTQPTWLLASAPEGAVGVQQAKAQAAAGQEIVLRGKIGGRSDAITEGAPVFLVMDTSIPSCADNPEDECETPWDYCCEPEEVKTANMATVQLVDSSGVSLEADLAAAGIKPLDEVIVIGTVAPAAEGVLVVKATALHRVQG
ncbi:MAG TPA: hypothetical protein VFF69_11395 [Phycisphaerales bacterium]|nr:hypothetical protein [Phycisphaerales bacterium]